MGERYFFLFIGSFEKCPVGSSGGYTYHGYTSHASSRAYGARLGRKVSRNGKTQFLLFIGTFEKFLEMGEMQFFLFIGTFEKCLEMGETQFLLFIGRFEKCLEMGEK